MNVATTCTETIRGLVGPTRLPNTGPGFARRVKAPSMFDPLLDWQDRAMQHHRLAQLDDRMLRDMGLTRADVEP